MFFIVLFCTVMWRGSGFRIVPVPESVCEFFNVLLCTAMWRGPGSRIVPVLESVCEFFNVLFCTGAVAGGGKIAGGRLRVSATTFLGPGTCRKSVVNSEMYANWRTCLVDQVADTRRMARVSGM
jgi:hypothetical protein